MNTTPLLKSAMVLAAGLLLSVAAQAATFHYDIQTSALQTPALITNAPFYLDFQFIDGGNLGNNTVSVSNFSFGGGAAVGAATLFDGAIGDFASGVTFDNSGPSQEFYQQFTPGTVISFDVATLTDAVDNLSSDAFFVFILKSDTTNIPGSGLAGSLGSLTLRSSDPQYAYVTQATFSGTGAYSGVVAAPEPSRAVLLIGGLGAVFLRRKRA